MGQRTFTVAKHMSQIENPPFPSRKQFFAGKLRRGVEITRNPRAIIANQCGLKRMQMRLIAG
jgi:hypothetical protein